MNYGKKINIKNLISEIESIIQSGIRSGTFSNSNSNPVFLWGPPGVGKTAIVNQLARKYNFKLYSFYLYFYNITDLRGFPDLRSNDKFVVWKRNDFLPWEDTETDFAILFLDELGNSDLDTMKAALQIALERKVSEHKLSDKVFIIAASNRIEDSQFINMLPDPLINRFDHYEIIPDVDSWIEWAIKNKIHPMIISFIKFKPDMLYKKIDGYLNFASPRSWEFANKRYQIGLDIAPSVSEPIAHEFYIFEKVSRKLPNVDDVLIMKKRISDILDFNRVDIAIVVLTNIAIKTTKENLDFILENILEIPNEFAIYLFKLLLNRMSKEIITSKIFNKLMEKFGNAIV